MLLKIKLTAVLFLCSIFLFSQTSINGIVKDEKGTPILGVNIYIKSLPSNGTTSNFEGRFSLKEVKQNDTLIISYVTYKTKKVLLSNLNTKKEVIIILKENSQTLDEVIILGKDPISEKFSVKKVSKLDIYFNPVSKGDPLNSILILPASTNTDESANPNLRGGSADRSRVYINGSPIINPVRNTQDNGLGNFSILNTEIINKQYVYASNPPLTYGNSSAGIVEIETTKKLNTENIQISLALSNLGLMINKNINKKTFFQFYTNNQFSDLLININKKNLQKLNTFSSQDLGLNFRTEINKNLSVNSYSYYINENYEGRNYNLNFIGISKAKQKRFFTINNVNYYKNKSNITLSTLFDSSTKYFDYGVINSVSNYNNFYLALSHKYKINNNLTLQYGLNHYNTNYNYNEIIPLYFYAISNGSPVINNNEKIKFNYSEIFLYSNYKINNDLGLSGAIRKNIFKNDVISDYLSYQISSFYNINNRNRLIFGFGNYYSYSTPNYYNHKISLLNSKQISLDYYLTKRKYSLTSALYYKTDKGNIENNNIQNFDKINTLGFEISYNYNLNKYFSFGVSNTFLEQKGYLNKTKLNTSNNLKYFLKTQLTYNNPKYFTTSLSLITRPGNNYTGISSSFFNSESNNYQPIFETINNQTYNKYFKLDFTVNKVFNVYEDPLIAYISINNLFNNKNQSNIHYNGNYSNSTFDFYQQRIIYFGVQYRLNHLFKKNVRDVP
tara:strand:+ start:5735 stop:7918 length:2184 start_codon:yes stop_codon:yes gene_type:complete